jgi:hypothetical protein
VAAVLHDLSVKLESSSRYLPSTFEERGVSVPFTTPKLAHARARKNYRDQLELCLPQFASTEGHYIIPWSAVSEVVQPTLHDKLLYERALELDVRTPHAMRLAALAVARDGLAGPEVAAAAAKALASDEEHKALNHVVLILRVLSETGKSLGIDLRAIASSDRQEHVRKALFRVATDLSVPAEVLDDRLTHLAIMTYMVGVPWSPSEGRLRVLVRTLTQFRDTMRGWGTDQIHDAGEKAVFCAAVADVTLAISAELLQQFDGLLKSPFALVVGWEKSKGEPVRLSERLSWILDGWEMIIELWTGCNDDNERITTVEQIVAVLPLIPRNELAASQREAANQLAEKGQRWVRLNQNWLTGEFDLDMIRRIELAKARSK